MKNEEYNFWRKRNQTRKANLKTAVQQLIRIDYFGADDV